MGKKKRQEREEKRESFAATRGRQKRKNMLIAIGVLAGIAAVVGISAYNFATMQGNTPGTPPGAGTLGDEHVHSSMLVKIFGDKFDFSLPAYQIKNSWIHFEAQDGSTIHRHSTGVTTGYL
ncbi:MAG: protein-disulfide isomerase, partial [Nitrosopumilaceae archaeon]